MHEAQASAPPLQPPHTHTPHTHTHARTHTHDAPLTQLSQPSRVDVHEAATAMSLCAKGRRRGADVCVRAGG